MALGPLLAYSLGKVRRMTKLEKLIEEARQLALADRVRLLDEVERSLEGRRAEASGPSPYASLISMAGSVPSDFSDVSIDKYRHLADACAPRPGDE